MMNPPSVRTSVTSGAAAGAGGMPCRWIRSLMRLRFVSSPMSACSFVAAPRGGPRFGWSRHWITLDDAFALEIRENADQLGARLLLGSQRLHGVVVRLFQPLPAPAVAEIEDKPSRRVEREQIRIIGREDDTDLHLTQRPGPDVWDLSPAGAPVRHADRPRCSG